ncbi:MAG: RNA polymerase sigma factor [Pyrinomonadaceae bacterium]
MKKDFTLQQKDFDALLGWLSANREEAGRQYERIREGLIRFFRFRGCADPETLADETINRVALKVSTFDSSKNIKTITYFYGFASNIYLEYLRTVKSREVQLETDYLLDTQSFAVTDDSSITECDCLENCLTKLSREESNLIIQYYERDKSEKFDWRREIAERMNLKKPALHTKVFRIRGILRECVEECLRKKSL